MANLKTKNFLLHAFSLVFRETIYIFLALSLALNLLFLYYIFFFQATTFKVFFESNSALYNWLSIISTVLIALSFGLAVSFLIWQRRQQKESNPANTGNTFIGSFLGALSIGCPACGAFLASLLGIAGGLAAFPFQGLEIKAVSLGLLGFALLSSAKSISQRADGDCQRPEKEEPLRPGQKRLIFAIDKATIRSLILPAAIGFSLLFLIAYLPAMADKFNFGFSFQKSPSATISQTISSSPSTQTNSTDLLEKINPGSGWTIRAVFGDIGPRLLEAGAIDLDKMKKLYEQAEQPLSEEQLKILTQGSDEKIKIVPENSYFLLNFLWALGLANKNPILDEGPMMKSGADKIGNFASTGGWSLGKKKATELYSKFELIKLSPEQQKILEDFAFNSYRPCCSNPTGFPDCNHGMAALGLGEIMASQGASVDEIFEAFKYVNAFWFPQTYFDLAKYFQAKEGKDWSQVDGRTVAGQDYSTPQGWSRARNWLKTAGLLEEAPSGGGGCGV